MQRKLGSTGPVVSAMGMGCWAIGGVFSRDGRPVGWGRVNDEESIRAIRKALDLGITFFDTADCYGCGHSERILGQALGSDWEDIVIATKFGHAFDEDSMAITRADATPEYIRSACEASLDRLGVPVIDLYQLHIGDLEIDQALVAREVLEELVAGGRIKSYGWSTDDPERARAFAEGENCAAVQHRLNIFEGDHDTLMVAEDCGLASINRGPLAMGLLTGKFNRETSIGADDVRHGWNFREGERAEQLDMLDAIRAILTSDGRTLAQGAIAWLWARSPNTIPIPGFKSVAQVEENTGALERGPLTEEQMEQIEEVLAAFHGEEEPEE